MSKANKTKDAIQVRKNMINSALVEAKEHLNYYKDYAGTLSNCKNNVTQCSFLIYPKLSSLPEPELKEEHQKLVTKIFEYFDQWKQSIEHRSSQNKTITQKEQQDYKEYSGYVNELKTNFPTYVAIKNQNVAANRDSNIEFGDIDVDVIEITPSEDLYNYNQEGIKAFEQGNYKKAIEQYKKALSNPIIDEDHKYSINSNLTKAYNQWGIDLCKEKKYEEAIECHKESLQYCLPKYKHIVNANIAHVHNQQNYYKIEFYKEILKHSKDPDIKQRLVSTYDQLGTDLKEQRNYQEAVKQYREALKYCPKEHKHIMESKITNIYGQQGVDLHTEGNYREAIKQYEKALKTCPEEYKHVIKTNIAKANTNIADTYNQKGLALHKNGNYKEASINYKKAITHFVIKKELKYRFNLLKTKAFSSLKFFPKNGYIFTPSNFKILNCS